MAAPAAFVGCPELLRVLPSIFRGWSIERCAPGASPDPVLTVTREARSYRLDAPWLPAPLRRGQAADALCGFIAELIRALVAADAELLCLHGATVEVDGRLVVFPNRYRAGKSTLSACLAAAGYRVFGDDVLPIRGERDRAFAAGIAPRLRLPLPADLGADVRDLVDRHSGPKSERYLYLDLPEDRLAPFGAEAEIGAFVLIERDPDAEPGLAPVAKSEVLRQVIWQNFARDGDASRILDRLSRIVDRAAGFRLRYRSAAEAVALLTGAFAGAAPSGAGPGPARPQGVATAGISDTHAATAPGYRRNPWINEVEVDGERFLADSRCGTIHHLNPLASALWRLLQEWATREEIVELLRAAFPETSLETIESDVSALLDQFRLSGLVAEDAGGAER